MNKRAKCCNRSTLHHASTNTRLTDDIVMYRYEVARNRKQQRWHLERIFFFLLPKKCGETGGALSSLASRLRLLDRTFRKRDCPGSVGDSKDKCKTRQSEKPKCRIATLSLAKLNSASCCDLLRATGALASPAIRLCNLPLQPLSKALTWSYFIAYLPRFQGDEALESLVVRMIVESLSDDS